MLGCVCICVGRCVQSVLLTGGVCVCVFCGMLHIFRIYVLVCVCCVCFMNGGVCVCDDEIWNRT